VNDDVHSVHHHCCLRCCTLPRVFIMGGARCVRQHAATWTRLSVKARGLLKASLADGSAVGGFMVRNVNVSM